MKHEPGMAYKSSTLHKVFAIFSIILLFSVLGMFLDDFIRPWKGWQIKSLAVKENKIRKDIEAAEGEMSPEKMEEIKQQIIEGKKIADERSAEIDVLEEDAKSLRGMIHAQKLELAVFNGMVSELTFKWELANEKKKPSAPKLKENLAKNKAGFAATKAKIRELEFSLKDVETEITEKKKVMITAQKNLDRMTSKVELLEFALEKTNMANPIWIIRNMPFLDFLDPTLKVDQVVLSRVTDDRYFQHVPKVDRCMTCHVFIDQKGYEEEDQPFRTHPNLDMFAAMDSTHPKTEFGCTSCHGGEGHRVNDFNSIAHTPQNEEQKLAWMDKYNWHEPHKIPEPMLPLQYTEASCYKCHKGVEVVPMATKYNKGKELIQSYGCYACHVMPEFEHKKKPGPSLVRLAAKLDKNWVKNWIWDPFGFNPHSRMPAFFKQTNNSAEKFQVKNMAEVNAMAEYLFENAKDYKPFMKHRKGNVERGKELITAVGCVSCHQVEGIEVSETVGAQRGPYLTGTGSKVDKDWLVSWLKKPSHYQEDTIMPSFRLTDRETYDIAEYLLSLKNDRFQEKEFIDLDKNIRDDLLIEYFTAFDTMEIAQAKLAKMSDHERTQELGRRSIGKYGCYSCHSIEGFAEDRAPIGPNLSKEGSKPVHQFGFGHEKQVGHTRHEWITAHLENPRRWDKGVDKAFKDLTRMPQFYLEQDEIEAMVTVILGYVDQKIPEKGVRQLTASEGLAEKGFKHVVKYNCMGCHKIDGVGGKVLAMYEDDLNEGPPWLVDEGHRVHTDWLHHFFGNVYPIRPWLQIRMPSFNFTNQEKNEIVAYFQQSSEQVTFEPRPIRVDWEPGEKRAAKALFESYACASCHTTGFNNDEAAAPNLYLAKGRLRASWMEKWLRNPYEILPYTVMPNFWEDGVAQDESILGGDVDKQIRALRKYLQEIGYEEFHGQMNKSAGRR